jgi:hypothetical protein
MNWLIPAETEENLGTAGDRYSTIEKQAESLGVVRKTEDRP